MERWKELEFEYGRRLRHCTRGERFRLYQEAYGAVSAARWAEPGGPPPGERTEGTGPAVVDALAGLCKPSDRVLEVGCGRGYTILRLAPLVREAVGIDVSEPAIRESREVAAERGLTNLAFFQAGATELISRFPNGGFDKVISIDVYEHLHAEDGAEHLAQAYELLRPGGAYILIAPNRHTGPSDVTRLEFPEAREPRGFHLNEPTLAEIVALVRKIGYRRLRTWTWINYASSPWMKWTWPWGTLNYPVAWPQALERLTGGQGWIRDSRLMSKLLMVSLIARKPTR